MRAALFTRDHNMISEAQCAPLYQYREELKARFDFVFDVIKIQDNRNAEEITQKYSVDYSKYDLALILARALPKGDVKDRKELRRKLIQSIPVKVVFLDDGDSSGLGHPYLLPDVDLYVKKQLLKDMEAYRYPHLGGALHSDYLTKKYKVEGVQKVSRVLQSKDMHKLLLGWNLGTHAALSSSMERGEYLQALKVRERSWDVQCRVGVQRTAETRSYFLHRAEAIREVKKLDLDYRVVATEDFLPLEAFLQELKQSKICVSPFGWGEICRRDFEAIAEGAMLIKPSMEHLRTEPDLFVPNETYVPVRWDLIDLTEKCRYYLEHPQERTRIVENAAKVYARYFAEKRFLDPMGQILERLGAPVG